ncbi:MAG TPA: hypothetical protein VFA20_01015 [Myxococcaceae bacterium]|nr:hypothetical protein [Myxococcaceae bacterium]
MTTETLEHRALAAIRFLDEETRQPVRAPLKLSGDGMRFVRNLRGLHVLTDAPGFSDYADSYDLPETPPPTATFTITASDPSHTYLARRFTVQLPRDPTPGADEDLPSDSVFKPVEVLLYPSPVARASAGSAVVRLTVTDNADKPLAGALVELTLETPSIVRRGLSDERGEAQIQLPGIPIADWADPAVTNEFDLSVKAAWAAGTEPPNPDALAASLLPVAGVSIQVTTGAEVARTIKLTWITS